MNKLFLVIISFVIFFASVGISQVYNYDEPGIKLKFKHFSVEQGLSQSTVNSIIQDDKGFIWIGTQNGLNMFDGFKFTVYTNDTRDTNSLSDDHIYSILQDKNGFMWVGTDNGLNVFTLIRDKETGELKEGFYHFLNDQQNPESLSSSQIRTIYQDKSGSLWVGTVNGLNRAEVNYNKIQSGNPESAVTFKHYFSNPDNPKSYNFISQVAVTDSNLWVGTMGGGLYQINTQTEKRIRYTSNPFDPSSLGGNYILRLYVDHSGELWIGTYGGGLCKYDRNSNTFVRYKRKLNDENSISDNRIYSIDEDADGNFWIGTFDYGVDRFNHEEGKFRNFRKVEYYSNSLSNDFARVIYVDRSNNLWVGTNHGLNEADLKFPKFSLFRNDPWASPSLSDDFVLSFYEDDEGYLWIGTNEGLDKYDQKNNTYTNYKITHNNPRSGEGFVYSIYQDESGMFWLGTFGGGILKYDPNKSGRIVKQYLHYPNNIKGIIDNRVTTIYPDSNGDLIIGTAAGVCRFNRKSEEFKYYLLSSQDSSMLSGVWINRIYKDSEKFYWVGTSKGLFRIDSSSGKCDSLSYVPDDKSSLSNNYVTSLYEDNNKILWIGTDEGLNMFNGKTRQLVQYYKNDGLPGNSITNILGDDNENLWIATNNGISRFNIKTKQFRNYDVDDGLQGMEFNVGACLRNKNGEMFFGGLNGFNKFNPVNLKDNPSPPEIAITAFKKFDKIEKGYMELSKLDVIELSYEDRFFSFEFSSLEFTNPEKNQYAYMLENFDNDWNYIGNRRFANYTNVSPGQYVFRVKGSNNDGVWNEKGASISIIITPPFYNTWWAYTVYAIMFVTVIFSVRHYEVKKRKREKETILKEEREKAKLKEVELRADRAELLAKAIEADKEIEKQRMRYRIASDLHDEIGSNLSSISLISSILKKNIDDNFSNPHEDNEVLNKLNDINFAAKSSAESIRDIVWFINPMSDQISNLISKIKETANMMLGNISYEVTTNFPSYDQKIAPDIKRNIYLIYKEALNNIIKHSKACNVNISLKKESGNIILSVFDNGIGFDETEEKTGNGLRNLKGRASQIQGNLVIKSVPGKGTIITLSVAV